MLFSFCFLLSACSKTDPILPGTRISIFDDELAVQNTDIPTAVLEKAITGQTAAVTVPESKTYEQDSSNVIWEIAADGTRRKIFSGFPTAAHVSANRAPVFVDGFIYAGFSTGEVVKINAKTRAMKWAADIFKGSAMTGGGGIVDIVAPVVVHEKHVYAGGMGGAFCKLKDATGAKVWCNWIGVATPFSIYSGLAFVIATDGYLYAINTNDGGVYWRANTKCDSAPKLSDNNGTFVVRCSAGKKQEGFSARDGSSL